jgi:hypothetical protein
MVTKTRVLALVAALVVAACGGDDEDARETTTTSPPTSTSDAASAGPEVAFEDALDDDSNGWGESTAAGERLAFEGGVYVAELAGERELVAFADAFTESLSDATLAVRVGEPGGGPGRSGVACRIVGTSWYSLAVGEDGTAFIERWDDGTPTVLATEEAVVEPGPHELRSTCGEGSAAGSVALSLSIDGSEVLATEDASPIGPGMVGLFLHSASPEVFTTSFDDFQVETPT